MNLLAWRLVLSASLFVGWLGYLGYLVATRPLTAAGAPLVLSRAQLMVSPIDIVAEVADPDDPAVVVKEVLYPADAPVKVGQKLTVFDLDLCHPMPRRQNDEPPRDLTGPGPYLIPLRPSGREKGAYEVVPIPTSPGFDARRMENLGVRPVRIYPYNGETAAQYRRIEKPNAP
jgi:hypothetical protein